MPDTRRIIVVLSRAVSFLCPKAGSLDKVLINFHESSDGRNVRRTRASPCQRPSPVLRLAARGRAGASEAVEGGAPAPSTRARTLPPTDVGTVWTDSSFLPRSTIWLDSFSSSLDLDVGSACCFLRRGAISRRRGYRSGSWHL